eukprot:3323921-Pleurochrysis_carterae.AAC.5
MAQTGAVNWHTARHSGSNRQTALHSPLKLAVVSWYLPWLDCPPGPSRHDPGPPIGRYQRTGRDMMRVCQSREMPRLRGDLEVAKLECQLSGTAPGRCIA